MNSKQHHIKTQAFDISLDDENKVHRFQSQLSRLQEHRIEQLIERIFNKYSRNGQVYRFDKVTLDLGRIKASNLETEVVDRIEEELTNFFRSCIRDDGSLKTGRSIIAPDHELELFGHFLLNGRLKWNAAETHSPSSLLNNLLKHNRKALYRLLVTSGKKATVRKRIILQYPEKPLENIVTLLSPEESDYIISYKRNLLKAHKKKKLVNSRPDKFRSAVWEIILAYLLVENKSYHDRKAFLHHLIEKIAEKHSLRYKTLLHAISGKISSEKTGLKKHRFKNLILELKKELPRNKISDTKKKKQEQHLKTSLPALLQQFNTFIESGSFPTPPVFSSQQDFNDRLVKAMKKSGTRSGEILRIRLTDWLGTPLKKHRFFTLAEERALQIMFENITGKHIHTQRQFFGALEKLKPVGQTEESRMLDAVLSFRFRILFQLAVSNPLLKRENRKAFLHALATLMLKEAGNKRIIMLSIFKKTLPLLSDKQRTVIKAFLKHEKQVGTETTEKEEHELRWQKSILSDINENIIRNEQELWAFKLREKIPEWSKVQGIRPGDVLDFLKFHFSETAHMPGFLEAIRAIETERDGKGRTEEIVLPEARDQAVEVLQKDIEKLFSESGTLLSVGKSKVMALLHHFGRHRQLPASKLLKQLLERTKKSPGKKDLYRKLVDLNVESNSSEESTPGREDREKKKRVQYVLEKGCLPWWCESYDINSFNEELSFLWAYGDKKALAAMILDKADKAAAAELFNHDNLYCYWRELDQQPGKHSSELVIRLHRLLSQQLLPAGKISMQQYKVIEKQLFMSFTESSYRSFNASLFPVFFRWIDASSGLQHDAASISDFLQALVAYARKSNSAAQKQVEKFVKQPGVDNKALMHEDITGKSRKSIMHRLLEKHLEESGKQPADGYSLKEQIRETGKAEPKLLKEWIKKASFREQLRDMLSNAELNELVRVQLNPWQKAMYEAALHILRLSHYHLSITQLKQWTDNFYMSLLLSIGSGDIHSWRKKNWSRLLFHSFPLVSKKSQARSLNLILQKAFPKQKHSPSKENIISGLVTLMKQESALFDKAEEEEKLKKEKEENYRRLEENENTEMTDPIYVTNAGMVILAPFLGHLFKKCNLLEGERFIDTDSRWKAVHLLEYATTGKTGKEEHELVMNKLLCGMAIADPVDRNVILNREEKEMTDSLLEAVIRQWSALKNTSKEGLREAFLQRNGKLDEEEELFRLKVEEKAYDMLLDRIPWGIGNIKLSWMDKMLQTEWR